MYRALIAGRFRQVIAPLYMPAALLRQRPFGVLLPRLLREEENRVRDFANAFQAVPFSDQAG